MNCSDGIIDFVDQYDFFGGLLICIRSDNTWIHA